MASCDLLPGQPSAVDALDAVSVQSLARCAGRRLTHLQEEVETLRGDVDARLASIELRIDHYTKNCQVVTMRDLVNIEPSVDIPQISATHIEQLNSNMQDLQCRLQRLELLLFCIPIHNFKEIDNAIKSFMNGDSQTSRTSNGVASHDESLSLLEDDRGNHNSCLDQKMKHPLSSEAIYHAQQSEKFERGSIQISSAEGALGKQMCEADIDNVIPTNIDALSAKTFFSSEGGPSDWLANETKNADTTDPTFCESDAFASLFEDMKDVAAAEEKLKMLHALSAAFAGEEGDAESSGFLNEM